MALEIKLQQKLSQSLVLTPQLQQAIKLLQLGHQDYVEVVERELLENPALEEVLSENTTREQSEQNPRDHSEISFGDSVEGDGSPQIRQEQRAEEFEFNGQFYETARRSGPPEDVISALEGSISAPEGLSSHLLWQLQTTDLNEKERQVAAYIIGNLDENGFLLLDVSIIAEEFNYSEDFIEEVLKEVQSFDPPGVGARNLEESLRIQLEGQGKRDTLVWRIVVGHLADLEIRNYDNISKALGEPKEVIYEAIKELQNLEPRPARNYEVEPAHYISPDVYIKKIGNDYVISLNDSGLPRLRLSKEYQSILGSNSASLKGTDKEYLTERLKAAQWLLKSIHQRQQTIYKVTESIMKHQKEFLELGIPALKPLVLREVAADVGLHESTISRVTSNKYVHTPHGVFELKFFFASGLSSGAGDMSSEAVKDKIKDLVSKENLKKPLSDQQLVVALKAEGIDIARRTVAKYREMLGILSSSRRKKIF